MYTGPYFVVSVVSRALEAFTKSSVASWLKAQPKPPSRIRILNALCCRGSGSRRRRRRSTSSSRVAVE